MEQLQNSGIRHGFVRMTYEHAYTDIGAEAQQEEAYTTQTTEPLVSRDGESERSENEQAGSIRIRGPRAHLDDISPQELGEEGERIAVACLERMGYTIVRRNWRCLAGEADIVARIDDEHVLVEVKTRLVTDRNRDPWPELAVDARKRERYRVMAELYLQELDEPALVRFDVIAVNIVGEGVAKVRYLEGAFECDC